MIENDLCSHNVKLDRLLVRSNSTLMVFDVDCCEESSAGIIHEDPPKTTCTNSKQTNNTRIHQLKNTEHTKRKNSAVI